MMMTYYAGLVVFAAALTAAWLFRPDERTVLTTMGAFLSWSLAALAGGSVEIYDETNAEFVAATAPAEIRWFMVAWAVLSLLALVLYTLGHYPPADDERLPHDTQT